MILGLITSTELIKVRDKTTFTATACVREFSGLVHFPNYALNISLVGWVTFFDPTLSEQIVGFGEMNPTV